MALIYKNGVYYGRQGIEGHSIYNSSDVRATQRTALKFGGDLSVSDNDNTEQTEVSPHALTQAEMNEILEDKPLSVNSGLKYSTEEQVVGEWIDGKPLYQKTVDCGALPNATIKEVAHNINNISLIISLFGFAWGSDMSSWISLPLVMSNNVGNNIMLLANNTNIRISPGSDRSAYSNSYVTIQYTKTTD